MLQTIYEAKNNALCTHGHCTAEKLQQ